jgi:hypothetical protein
MPKNDRFTKFGKMPAQFADRSRRDIAVAKQFKTGRLPNIPLFRFDFDVDGFTLGDFCKQEF